MTKDNSIGHSHISVSDTHLYNDINNNNNNTTTTTTTTTSTSTSTNMNNVVEEEKKKISSEMHVESGGFFTLKEYKILSVICDTIISDDSITSKDLIQQQQTCESVDENIDIHDVEKKWSLVKDFYKRKATDLDIASHFLKLISMTRTRAQISDLKLLLYLFSSSGPGFILSGSFSSFITLDLKTRQKIFSNLKQSKNPIRRQAFKAIVPLVYSLFVTVLQENGTNPNWGALNYAAPPPPEQIPGDEKLSFIKINSERSMKADVVVIGSGAGGGVTAALLSQAGYKVIVLEKGPYVSPNNMSWKEGEAFPLMYEQAGTLTSDDLSINVLAGSCLGGGTTVNWAASIKTPEHVLQDWRKECPNTFAPDRYNEAQQQVCARLNVNIDQSTDHNKPNQLLAKGMTDMDIETELIPRNVKNCDTNSCGFCSMGCRTKAKQSSMVTYLEDCCSNGGQIITNCYAEEITHTNSTTHGVIAYAVMPDGVRFRVFIKTHIVVVSAGAIHTPALLQRSKIKNPNIGASLYLHPVCPVIGAFKESVELWKGVPMSVIAKEWMGQHGTIIETPNAHLGVCSSISSFQWENSVSFKEQFMDIAKYTAFIPILRDSKPGRVKLDKDQRSPRIVYTLASQDWKNLLPGVEGAVRAMVNAGATRVCVPVAGIPPLQDMSQLDDYLTKIKSLPYKPNLQTIISAHQMGSCRMGSTRNNSVVNENGESWDIKRLFIADGSVLPSAVGVNPMITIYAVSHIIANQIISLYPPPDTSISFERNR